MFHKKNIVKYSLQITFDISELCSEYVALREKYKYRS